MDWRPVSEAVPDGTVCRLRFRDFAGYYEPEGEFFLHDDGHWYRINPPTQMAKSPTHWAAIR